MPTGPATLGPRLPRHGSPGGYSWLNVLQLEAVFGAQAGARPPNAWPAAGELGAFVLSGIAGAIIGCKIFKGIGDKSVIFLSMGKLIAEARTWV